MVNPVMFVSIIEILLVADYKMFEVFSTDIWGTNQNNLNKFDRHSPMEHLYKIFEIGP